MITAPSPADAGETACRTRLHENPDQPLVVSRPGQPPLMAGGPPTEPHVWMHVGHDHITVFADGHPYRAVVAYPPDLADITGPDFHHQLRVAVEAALAVVCQAIAVVVR
jgi:hypothetical protein